MTEWKCVGALPRTMIYSCPECRALVGAGDREAHTNWHVEAMRKINVSSILPDIGFSRRPL